jgi:hypothetical protein|tara:strand:- start:2042 stop:2617 length:576 start_codon:yes stop_codon:yes gene_type:complete
MKGVVAFLIVMFLLGGISAECSDGQIDINTASESELDEITYVGPATAQSIFSKRPFGEVDDLIHVSGIGEVKLNAIKEEGLACVADEPPEDEKTPEEEEVLQLEDQEKDKSRPYKYRNIDEFLVDNSPQDDMKTGEEFLVQLTPKTIKSDNSSESKTKGEYAIYGLIVFCFLLAFLFLIKKMRKRKTEFQK